MYVWLTQTTNVTPGPQITFDCPSCKTRDVVGNTNDVEERNKFFWVIPFFTTRWVTINCTQCGKQFGSSRKTGELGQMSHEQITEMIAAWQETHVPFLVKFTVIISVVLGILPYMGLIFALIAIAFTFKRRTGWRTAAFVGLGLSLISTLLVTILMMSAHK